MRTLRLSALILAAAIAAPTPIQAAGLRIYYGSKVLSFVRLAQEETPRDAFSAIIIFAIPNNYSDGRKAWQEWGVAAAADNVEGPNQIVTVYCTDVCLAVAQ